MSIRLSTAVDVLITAPGPTASEDQVTAALLRHTKADAARAAEWASMILTGKKVCFEYHSDQSAAALAEELRSMGMTVTIQK
jgi:hypothetical protein